jgi:hypothetical protein
MNDEVCLILVFTALPLTLDFRVFKKFLKEDRTNHGDEAQNETIDTLATEIDPFQATIDAGWQRMTTGVAIDGMADEHTSDS